MADGLVALVTFSRPELRQLVELRVDEVAGTDLEAQLLLHGLLDGGLKSISICEKLDKRLSFQFHPILL